MSISAFKKNYREKPFVFFSVRIFGNLKILSGDFMKVEKPQK